MDDIVYVNAVETGVFVVDKNDKSWKMSEDAPGNEIFQAMPWDDLHLRSYQFTPDTQFGVGFNNLNEAYAYKDGTWTAIPGVKMRFVAIQPTTTNPEMYASSAAHLEAFKKGVRAHSWTPTDRGTTAKQGTRKGKFNSAYKCDKQYCSGNNYKNDIERTGGEFRVGKLTGGTCDWCGGWNAA